MHGHYFTPILTLQYKIRYILCCSSAKNTSTQSFSHTAAALQYQSRYILCSRLAKIMLMDTILRPFERCNTKLCTFCAVARPRAWFDAHSNAESSAHVAAALECRIQYILCRGCTKNTCVDTILRAHSLFFAIARRKIRSRAWFDAHSNNESLAFAAAAVKCRIQYVLCLRSTKNT